MSRGLHGTVEHIQTGTSGTESPAAAVCVENETVGDIESFAEKRGSSVSQVTRDLIRKGLEYDDLKNERDRLERQLAATNSRIDDVTELAGYLVW